MALKHLWLFPGSALLLLMWSRYVLLVGERRGFFDWLGLDFAVFYAGARAFLSEGPSGVYDLTTLAVYIGPLTTYYGPQADPYKVGPIAYPPPLMLLFLPFALLPPIISFALWTAINLLLGVIVIRGLVRNTRMGSWLVVLSALMSFPLAYTLFVGQPTVLLLFFFYRAYVAFEQGRELRAGLWTGLLLLKPHYAVVLLLVLLLKRRWRALAGCVVVAMAIGSSSLVMLGPGGIPKYLESVSSFSGFQAVHYSVYPEAMISWRGLLVNLLPGISEIEGMALTLILSVITICALLSIWRGPWCPGDERFRARMLATIIVTLLVGFHSHIHGGALLIVPALAFLAQGGGPWLIPRLLVVGLYLPVVLFYATGAVALVAMVLLGLMLVTLAAVVAAEWNWARALALSGAPSRTQRADW